MGIREPKDGWQKGQNAYIGLVSALPILAASNPVQNIPHFNCIDNGKVLKVKSVSLF